MGGEKIAAALILILEAGLALDEFSPESNPIRGVKDLFGIIQRRQAAALRISSATSSARFWRSALVSIFCKATPTSASEPAPKKAITSAFRFS